MSSLNALNGSAGLWPFVVLATLVVAGFAASLARALASPAAGARRSLTPSGWLLVLAVPLLVGVLYAVRGEPRALSEMAARSAPAGMPDMQVAVGKLAERLQREPGDIDGWLMLARSYSVLGRHADAAAAYEHASSRALTEIDLLLPWIESRLLAADQAFDPRSHELVRRAVELAPKHPDVLMLRALSAMARGDAADARGALVALREHHAPGSADREAIEHALGRIDGAAAR